MIVTLSFDFYHFLVRSNKSKICRQRTNKKKQNIYTGIWSRVLVGD